LAKALSQVQWPEQRGLLRLMVLHAAKNVVQHPNHVNDKRALVQNYAVKDHDDERWTMTETIEE